MNNAKTTHNPPKKPISVKKKDLLDAEGRRFIMINADGYEDIQKKNHRKSYKIIKNQRQKKA